MNFINTEDLKEYGFTGFKTVKELWDNRGSIPKERGIYLVIDPNYKNPEFISTGVGGFFKGKNPNVSISELRSNLVPNSPVIYIGKAGNLTGKATLNSRIGQYLRFGQTKNIGHWGGRFIWQIKNHPDLILCWKTTPNEDPRTVEKQLLQQYFEHYKKRPFANLTG